MEDQRGGPRRFSGEGKSPCQEYKQWKRWATAHVFVQKSKGVTPEALGPLLFSLLDGEALKSLDDVDIEDDLAVVGGETVVFTALNDRFPEQETSDRIGEMLDDVFGIRIQKTERTADYTGRVRGALARADREGISLPNIAKGYLLLRGARLSADRKAVVLAASRRSYEFDVIAQALRSTYPEGMPTERGAMAAVMEPDGDDEAGDDQSAEIDALLAEQEPPTISEEEAIQILATWKQQREAISSERLRRGFTPQKADRVDIEALKKKVRCHYCKKPGHFSRDCNKRKKDEQTSTSTSSSSTGRGRPALAADANMVWCVPEKDIVEVNVVATSSLDLDQEVESIMDSYYALEVDDIICLSTVLEEAVREEKIDRRRREASDPSTDDEEEEQLPEDILFAHDAGHGVVDTGCGRTLIGRVTLQRHEDRLREVGEQISYAKDYRTMIFKYGNGQSHRSEALAEIPCWLGGRRMILRAYVVPGEVPLLLSKGLMKTLGAKIDMTTDTMELTKIGVTISLREAQSGHYQIDLASKDPSPLTLSGAEVDVMKVVATEFDSEEVLIFQQGRAAALRPVVN